MDPEVFRTLALAEMQAVYRLAYHLTRRPDEVDDLVQETYLRAFKSMASFRPGEHGIRPWLFKILHNALNTRLSQEQRQRELAEGFHHERLSAPASQESFSLSQIDWERVDERLKAAIHELPLAQRTTFLLNAVEGFGYREIAEVTDVPIGTVMSRLYRTRMTLSFQLAALAVEQGMGSERENGIRNKGESRE